MKHKLFLFSFFYVLCCNLGFAQVIQISGQINSASDKLPIPGASVTIKGKKIGVLSDFDGKYSIEAGANETLVFSFVGSMAQEIVVGSRTVIDVVLSDMQELNAVVVVGYGVVKKSDLTGAVGSIKGDDLNVLSSPNIQTALGGRAAGLQVVSSGSVDGAVKVRIRGVGTINNADPLYVVDGFPTNDISHIAPSDIESMEVLKDASSSAIYGSRGANGVIMMTTKKGRNQKTQVQVNTYHGMRSVSKVLDLLDAADYARARIEAFENGIGGMSVNEKSILDFAILNNAKGTDWQREILQIGAIHNYKVAVLGGSDKINYNLSSTYNTEEGALKNTFVDKLFVKLNTQYQLAESVQFGSDIAYTKFKMSDSDLSNMYGSALMLATRLAPTSPVYDQFGNWGEQTMSNEHNAARISDMERYKKKSGNKFVGNFFLNYDILKGLSFKSSFGVDYGINKFTSFTPVYYVTPSEKNDVSQLVERRSTKLAWVWSNVFNCNFTLNAHHNFNAMVGTEATYSEFDLLEGTAFDVQESADMRYISAAKSNDFIAKSNQEKSTIFSAFFRANYAYKHRYLLTATLRSDASSRFSKQNRVGVFPSLSAGWNMKEELFMKDIRPVSQFKVRTGWGQVGNQASAGIGDYLSKISNGLKYVVGGEVVEGRIPTELSNPKLKWEIAEQYNVGLDVGLFNGKLSVTADYFIKNTNDMIVRVPIPNYVGANNPLANVGNMQNTGFEFSVNHTNSLSNFTYSLGFNLSLIKNKVVSLGRAGAIHETVYDNKHPNTSRTEVGHPIAYYYGYQTDGVFNTSDELAAYVFVDAQGVAKPIQPNAGLGDVKYVDRNGDGKINEADLTALGSYLPKFAGGFQIKLGYKNWDLSIFNDFVEGNKIANFNTSTIGTSSGIKNLLQDYYDNRWTPATPDNNQPKLTNGAVYQENALFSDRYIEDGSFFRIKNIQLSYTLPSHWINKVKMSGARIYVSADNLFTFTNYTGYNPEVADQWGKALAAGADVGGTPLTRTFTFGLNINF